MKSPLHISFVIYVYHVNHEKSVMHMTYMSDSLAESQKCKALQSLNPLLIPQGESAELPTRPQH